MPLDRVRSAAIRMKSKSARAIAGWRGTGTSSDGSRQAGWWDLFPFTTHQIELAPGLSTVMGGVDVEQDYRIDLVVDRCPGGLDGRTLVDLGCLEGGFALAFARRGATTLGIEAREMSVRRCEVARDLLGLELASFACADFKEELPRHAPFDVVFATGVLYHVVEPAALLELMREACKGFAVIDTHVAREDRVTHRCSPVVERSWSGRTYRGRMYKEYEPGSSEESKESMLWTAWSDADAFWPFEEDLVAMITDAGFARVERVDLDQARRSRWQVDHTNRVIYVAYV